MWKTYKRDDSVPREEKIALAELKRITSYLKLEISVEEKAKEIYNLIKEKYKDVIIELLVPASVYLACKKLNIRILDEKFEEATRKKIEDIKAISEKVT